VVIGGGNGIGEATCRLMSARGWHVVVADRDVPAAERVARDIGAGRRRVGSLLTRKASSAPRRRCSRWKACPPLSSSLRPVFQDVLPPEALPLPVWQRTIEVNLTGTWLANRSFGTRMAAHGGGSIVNIASIAAIASMPCARLRNQQSRRRSAHAQPRR
jgi:NAD(P)-dependent dehydrogenase (short-subunit alcohol dehydrogenase family)